MNRRDLLTTLPALAVSIPSTAIAQEPETEIMRLFREWQVYYEWIEGFGTNGMSDEAFNRVCDGLSEIEHKILSVPCKDPRDFVAKVVSWTRFGEADLPLRGDNAALWAEANKLIGVQA